MGGLEINFKIIDGLLAAKETDEKLHLEFVKNRVISHNTSFFETIKKSVITYISQKKKTPKTISVIKQDLQVLGLFCLVFIPGCIPLRLQIQVEHYTNQLQNIYSEIRLSSHYYNGVHIYDRIAIVRSVASQKTWGNYF